jgi:WD40 repeat protein
VTAPLRPTQFPLPARFTESFPGYQQQISNIAVSASGTTLAIADNNGICLWRIATGGCTVTITAVPAWAVAFGPDGKTVVGTESQNGTIRLSSTVTGRQVESVPEVPDSAGAGPLSVAFSPDGKTVAVGDQNGHAYLLDLATRKWTQLDLPNGGIMDAVAFNPSGTKLAVGDTNGDTYLVTMATQRVIATLKDPDTLNGVQALTFSHDGQLLATGDGNGNIYLWNAANGTRTTHFHDPDNGKGGAGGKGVLAVAFNPADTMLAAGDANGTAYLWKVSNGTLLDSLHNAQGEGVAAVAFIHDGKNLVTGNYKGTVDSWPVGQLPAG